MDVPIINKNASMVAGENAVIEVHKDLNGGATIVIKDSKHPSGYSLRVSPQIACGIAMTLLEVVGVPVRAELDRRLKEQLIKSLPR